MTAVRTVAEIEAELNAAKQAAYAEERRLRAEADEVKMAAKRVIWAEEKAKLQAKKDIVSQSIVNAINLVSTTLKATLVDGRVHIGSDRPYYTIEEEQSGGSWHSHATGKLRVSVGDYGRRTNYPQRKDGGHNYDAIAALMLTDARKNIAAREAELIRRGNINDVTALRTELNVTNYGTMAVSASSITDKPFLVEVGFKLTVTADKVREIHAALVTLGIIK